MAFNLSPEADALITDYMNREHLPSKSSAVNRLILMTLKPPAIQPAPSVTASPALQHQPPISTPPGNVAQFTSNQPAKQPAPNFAAPTLSGFTLP